MTRTYSLRWKFTSVIAAGTVMATILAAAGFSWRDWNRFWDRTGAEVSAVANIMASQLGVAVMLRDDRAAAEILESLRADSGIRQAALYTNAGPCFAVFSRERSLECPPRPADGILKRADALIVTTPVKADGERIGTISIVADVPSIGAVVHQYLQGATLVILLSLLVSAALAIWLQARVTAPILVIAGVARDMAETRQFGKRVPVSSADEVGALASSFNFMLQQIEERDRELAGHREQLEREVVERRLVNTELQHAKEKAESAVRLKAEFLANMSHEIRTPLNGVAGMVSLAREECQDAGVREQLETAQTAAQSLIVIVNDILDFSKMEAGKMTLESVDFNLRRSVEECLQLFNLTAREKNVALGFTLDDSCPLWVRGDPVRLRQVLINLVGNAVKFTPAGHVHLTVSAPEFNVIRAEVSDTGIGIPEQKIKTIFEPFTQADGSHTRRFGGSGLGLAIAQRLVTLMGGRLSAESEPGLGSRFIVTLPLREGTPQEASQPEKVLLDLPMLSVLVAEDNQVNQKVICGVLGRKRWPVTVVCDGDMAYKAFLHQRFDLILMDIQMPGVDGLDATRMIRGHERRFGLKRTPIIALTAHASPAQHAACFACGMDGVVVKPMDAQALFNCIRGLFATDDVAADHAAPAEISS